MAVGPKQGPGVVEVCGSPGEVANDPTLGHQFFVGIDRYGKSETDNFMDDLKNYQRLRPGNRKQMIRTAIALHAPDQLRQRVAWALAQTLVVAQGGSIVLGDSTEVWTNYYDIFVRNAFGSYRDVMREVAFNPIMAHYLTFFTSKSYS